MKILIQICTLIILFSSCGDGEIIYPSTFDFINNEEVGTSIVTHNLNGDLIEVNAIQSLNSSLCNVFNSIQSGQEISSITLLSESQLEITIDDGSAVNTTFTFPYAKQGDVILAEFGLSFDGNDKIISKVCNNYSFAPNKGISLAESNFCAIQDHLEEVKNRFTDGGFELGDTLGLCLINKIYKQR